MFDMWQFDALVIAHVLSGTIGLVTLWVPIVGTKGGTTHKRWGTIFSNALLITGVIAVGISAVTLTWPLETHPFSDDEAMVKGVFGWMMLYLATLTIMLSRYGMWCVRNRRNHRANRTTLNFTLQLATFVTAVNCAWHGYIINQPLMMGMSVVGIAAAILNTRFLLMNSPPLNEWLIQHQRGLVGAGISVYTAFLAFGAVNFLPSIALNPLLWAVPTVLGVSYLLFHQAKIVKQRMARTGKPATR